MSGGVEIGKCDICGRKASLTRKYYHYDIKCGCHSPVHSELVSHCNRCEPSEPMATIIHVSTETLKELTSPPTEVIIKGLMEALKDEDYRRSWVANIAMSFIDNERWYREKSNKVGKYLNYKDRHKIANDAAEYFILLLEK